MRRNGFARSLVFAAAAAAAWPAFALLAGPLLGLGAAFSVYATLAVALHLLGIAARPAQGALAACAALALGVFVALLTRSPAEAALGSALVLGALRSGMLYRTRSARALLAEGALLGGGLALARLLAAPGLLGGALGLWGFFLVQSVFFLLGGVGERRAGAAGLDPFELARTRLAALLDEE